MPIKQNARKAIRTATRRAAHNRKIKGRVRATLRTVRDATSVGNVTKAAHDLRIAQEALDKAARSGVITKNAASRKKSRLAALVKKTSKKAS